MKQHNKPASPEAEPPETETLAIEQVSWSTHAELLRLIRHKVFVEEQHVPESLEWDEHDETASHWIALGADGTLLGCARLQPDGKIGRMAVSAGHRDQGIGRMILDRVLEQAAETLDEVYLYAQVSAIGFYERAGFHAVGEEFDEADIPHRKMLLRFSPNQQPFDSRDAAADCLRRLLADTGQSLRLFVPHLAKPLLDDTETLDRIAAFARDHRGLGVRILIHDSAEAIRGGHRLVPLAQRLPSKIQVRRLPPEHRDRGDNFIVADERHVLFQESIARSEGEYLSADHPQGPATARRYAKIFDELWELGSPDPGLRVLGI